MNKNLLKGLIFSGLIGLVAYFLGKSFPLVGGPVFGILLGIILNNFKRPESFEAGIKFTSKKVLQYAVILLGFGLNLGEIIVVGKSSLLIILSTISTALIISFVVAKILNIDSNIATLVGVGSSICGGSAIAATAPVINAKDEDVATSISVIFLFNIIAALIFPTLGVKLGMTHTGFGMWAGTAINDTSSVVAASGTWSTMFNDDTALNYATIVKLTRTLAIIPITLSL
ncbi:MAG: putative sulfate exporter family transporter, partial [Peptoniphilus harei]|uniref:YeiH family protein n=1 Tax=Peptoniphilus harei TaxID=54005 RepID=UPI0028FE2CCD